jgi:tetratricopeptide (TPR) repeat protein
MPDAYSSCPCGSGKKFKWCCQPLYAAINHVWELEANGQHEAALKAMDEVTQTHESNPEAWGQKAKLLHVHGQVEEADAALERAFAINPGYPYGLLLRALFRFEEGEVPGALLLARRAAAAYDPEAHPYLADAYYLVFQCEHRLNHPVAARAAIRLAIHHAPDVDEFREIFEGLYGPQGRLPECARKDYTFRRPPDGLSGAARQEWDRALRSAANPRLNELPRLFEPLTQQSPDNAAAWFNLGLSRAWLGENRPALESLDRYVDLERDGGPAEEAAAVMEVLRCGAELVEQADYREYSFSVPIRNPEAVGALLNEWLESGRLRPMPEPPQGTFVGLMLELTTAQLVTVGRPAAEAGTLAGYLTVVGPMLVLTSPRKEPYERLREEVRTRLAIALGELAERQLPIQFQDVGADALLFPVVQREDNAERVRKHIESYFEDTWVHRPLHALRGNTPVDAAGSSRLRKDLRGVIRFLQDCSRGGALATYDFDRLRRKLGLLDAPAAAAPGAAASDIPAMGAAELGALDRAALTFAQLEQAYQAAHKLDADELAAHFARALVGRPAEADRPDRFPWYSFLAQRALRQGELDAALDLVNEGEKADCEQNEGRRRNEYELRRGQVHARRGEADAAEDVFRRLIERVPDNLRYRGAAAEAMLSLKQGARALRFAEEGVAAARTANDRDNEQYLQELAAAARKQS